MLLYQCMITVFYMETGIRMYEGNIFRLQDRINRLYDSAKSILLSIPHSRKVVIEDGIKVYEQLNVRILR